MRNVQSHKLRPQLLVLLSVGVVPATLGCGAEASPAPRGSNQGTGANATSGTGGGSATGGADTGGAVNGGGTGGAENNGGAAGATAGSGSGGAQGGAGGGTSAFRCPNGPFPSVDFTKLPAPAPVSGALTLEQTFHLFEGPVWTGTALLWSDVVSGQTPPVARIWKLEDGKTSVLAEGTNSNGLALTNDGQLLMTDHGAGVLKVSPLSDPKTASVLATGYDGVRFNSPNDLAVGPDGSVYFSDPTYQAPAVKPQAKPRLYRRAPDGTVSVVDDTFPGEGPNGVALSLDGDWLYVGGAQGTFKQYKLTNGAPDAGRDLKPELSIYEGYDGMAVDCAGRLYAVVGNNKVVVLAPDTASPPKLSKVGELAMPGQVTNVAFGGPNRSTLYVTQMGNTPAVLAVEVGVPGLPY